MERTSDGGSKPVNDLIMSAEKEYEKWVGQYFSREVDIELRTNSLYRQLWCSGYDYRKQEIADVKNRNKKLRAEIARLKSINSEQLSDSKDKQ